MDVTKQMVLDELDKLPRDTYNPTTIDEFENTTCVYTSADNRHCIAGQVLVNLGIEVPAFGTEDNTRPIGQLINDGHFPGHHFDEGSIRILTLMQQAADHLDHNHRPDATWGNAIDDVEDYLRD